MLLVQPKREHLIIFRILPTQFTKAPLEEGSLITSRWGSLITSRWDDPTH